jgi:hypothetical protein
VKPSPVSAIPNPESNLAVSVVAAPLAVCLLDAAKLVGVPSWFLRESILCGNLHAKKAGRTHVVLIDELKRWLASLDDVPVSTAPSILERKAAREQKAAQR